MWTRRLGGDPAAIGSTIRIDKTSYTIVGVAPKGFFGTTVGEAPDIWAPLAMGAQMPPAHWDGRNDPSFQSLYLIGRLKNDVSVQQATGAVNLIFKQSLQARAGSEALVWRTAGEPAAMIPMLRSRILEVNKFTAIIRVRTLNEMLSDSVAQPRFYTTLLGVFAGIALTLAALGIYGVTAYSVSQRTHEIGIRMALGAQTIWILRLVMGHGLISILAGVGLGIAGAIALTRLMTGLLFGVSETDAEVFSIIAVLLIAVALVACLIPARKATAVDPLAALRHE